MILYLLNNTEFKISKLVRISKKSGRIKLRNSSAFAKIYLYIKSRCKLQSDSFYSRKKYYYSASTLQKNYADAFYWAKKYVSFNIKYSSAEELRLYGKNN